MRETYRDELAAIGDLLSAMAHGVSRAMREATQGLLAKDRAAAEGVVGDDDEIDLLNRQVEEKVYATLALQAPVASDLRVMVTALQMAGDLERMGDLARHVARTA